MPRTPLRSPRKIFVDRNPVEEGDDKSRFAINFSWQILGVLGIFLICVIVWAFFMGFMVGQGHNPHTKIRELAGLPPAETISAQSETSDNPDEAKQPESPSAVSDLKPLETDNASEEIAPFRTPEGSGLAAWEKSSPAPAPVPKKDKTRQREELFDYSFQIAAFKNQTDAENLQKKLKGLGLKTVIRKSGNVQLIIANMRGNSGIPDSLAKKLAPLKLGRPLQLSRKPLSTKTKGSK